jgi:N-glycosylase/DNA lyase
MKQTYINEEWKVHVPFSLDHSLGCGQVFRWKKRENCWIGFIEDQLFELFFCEKSKMIRTRRIIDHDTKEYSPQKTNRELVERYFGLTDSISSIRQSIISNIAGKGYNWFVPRMEDILNRSYGLRILRQNTWEVVVSYLLSTQTTITALEKKLDTICGCFQNNRIVYEGEAYYSFPKKHELSALSEADFRRIGFGYRSCWLDQLVRRYDASVFDSIRTESFDKKLSFLLTFPGIGYKVANCILLFAYSEMSAFPVDVWISKWLNDMFGIEGNPEFLTLWGQSLFGAYAGYAQEYIFNFCRNLATGGRYA